MMEEDDPFSEKLSAPRDEIKESNSWLKDKIRKIGQLFTKSSSPSIGSMYLFVYDPKYKNILPYYDMYPLVIPIEFYTNGFLGINLHYLPPVARASLMDSLKKLSNDNKYNDKTKLNISYEILSRYASQFSGVENCIKRYLFAHVRSPFHKVSPEEWDKTIMLPLQRWQINSNKKYAGKPPY